MASLVIGMIACDLGTAWSMHGNNMLIVFWHAKLLRKKVVCKLASRCGLILVVRGHDSPFKMCGLLSCYAETPDDG
jgi:hypothetical protein